MLKVNNYYQIYFNSINNSVYEITGDTLPQCYWLTPVHYKYIWKSLEDYGFNVKVIYLISAPAERIWSNVRMEKNLYSSISKDISDSDCIRLNFKKINGDFIQSTISLLTV